MKLIHPGMKARLSDGSTAMVTDVLIDALDGAERYVVLSANGYFGPDVVAPISSVWRVDDHVHGEISSQEMAFLPHFVPLDYCRDNGLCSRAAASHGAGWHHTHSVSS